jgi:hypothetical protein
MPLVFVPRFCPLLTTPHQSTDYVVIYEELEAKGYMSVPVAVLLS